MRLTRVYVSERISVGGRTVLAAPASQHVTRVLRLTAGAQIVLFDGHGGEYDGEIVQTTRDAVSIAVQRHRAVEREAAVQLTLVQALARGEKMDWIVQKATELGVARIIPVALERSVVKLDERQGAKRVAHWEAIAINACEQCGRNRLPQVAAPCALSTALALSAPPSVDGMTAVKPALQLLLDPDASGSLQQYSASLPRKVSMLIGPEGGFTAAETAQALAAGYVALNFGARILRTETAAIAAVSVVQFLGETRFGNGAVN